MYTHIVFFKLKNPIEENINLVKNTILSMKGNIDELKYLEVGVDDIRSERSFDISLIARFNNKEDCLSYDINEYHVKNVKEIIKPYIEVSKSVDYED